MKYAITMALVLVSGCAPAPTGVGRCIHLGSGSFMPVCELPEVGPTEGLLAWYSGGTNPTPEWGVVERGGVVTCGNRVATADHVRQTTCPNGGAPVATGDNGPVSGYRCGWFVLPTPSECAALEASCGDLTAGCWVAAQTR